MEFIIITGPNFAVAHKKILKAIQNYDGIELRLDLFDNWSKEELQDIIAFCNQKNKKVLLTIRSKENGGGYDGLLHHLEETIYDLSLLSPHYMDVESNLSSNLFSNLANTNIISSYHDFEKTPSKLEELFLSMQKKSAYAYKLCTQALTTSDSYRMLNFVHKKKKEGHRVIGLCMGEKGKVTREDGLKVGNYLNYRIMSIRDKVAKGLIFA